MCIYMYVHIYIYMYANVFIHLYIHSLNVLCFTRAERPVSCGQVFKSNRQGSQGCIKETPRESNKATGVSLLGKLPPGLKSSMEA